MAKRCQSLVFSALGLLALAACSGLSNLGAPDNEAPIVPSQSNLASLTEVIQKHPDDPQAYNMRGSVLADSGNAEAALADFNKAISLDPNYAQAYANRGLLRRQAGKLDLALADYNKSLSIDGNYATAYVGRGIVHRQQGNKFRLWPTSTRRSRFVPTMLRPITIAVCFIRASVSISSPSMTSPRRSG